MRSLMSVDNGHRLASYDTSLVVSGGVDCRRRRRNVYDKKPQCYAKDNRTAHLTACSDKSVAYVTNNKRLYSTFCTVEANYWQTRSIARSLCDSRATCYVWQRSIAMQSTYQLQAVLFGCLSLTSRQHNETNDLTVSPSETLVFLHQIVLGRSRGYTTCEGKTVKNADFWPRHQVVHESCSLHYRFCQQPVWPSDVVDNSECPISFTTLDILLFMSPSLPAFCVPASSQDCSLLEASLVASALSYILLAVLAVLPPKSVFLCNKTIIKLLLQLSDLCNKQSCNTRFFLILQYCRCLAIKVIIIVILIVLISAFFVDCSKAA